ncbi:MAG: tRNA preQ1(34) S-adenosylmethionine ribosyltransferase-isomerase QueA [Methyloceanibacter sp.]|uniref:tRNA preQ1(34) S-adenosylmethionine ribosyltransferase-isomerase QueA n=1 Tax=Methyloceanibacter sp. TaxID=1965321 RepID=UPI003D6C9DA5
MRTDLFDYHLPEELIALRPVSPRDAARLLVVEPNAAEPLSDRMIGDLPELLSPGDALVFNDTKVIPAELAGTRERDGASAHVSVTLTDRIDANRWHALARPAKRLKPGDRIVFGEGGDVCLLGSLTATVEARGREGEVTLAFDFSDASLDQAIHRLGAMPLPPYIASRRAGDEQDRTDYQTLFARAEGAVAAPTAGLHFTERLMQALDARGISRHFVTLHVGPGTFLPVRSADTGGHVMHEETGTISAETAEALNAVKGKGGAIVAVGTTSLRLLESAADAHGRLAPFFGATNLFITPGYRFRFVDRLLTNFHLPRSTLFMLVAAFSGLETMKRAYAHAVEQRYRFYSYGDACLLSPGSGEGEPI